MLIVVWVVWVVALIRRDGGVRLQAAACCCGGRLRDSGHLGEGALAGFAVAECRFFALVQAVERGCRVSAMFQ